MIFWGLWIIGIVITVITRCLINSYLKPIVVNEGMWNQKKVNPQVSQIKLYKKIILHLLVIICIILVGGIAVAKFVGMFYEVPFWGQILLGLIPAFLTYIVGALVLDFDDFDSIRSQACFLTVFIVAIFGWTILINNYNKNIESITETSIEQTQERYLLYFCNVPVQEIAGEVSGSSSIFGGSVSGSIDTTHELTYWYINDAGKGVFDAVPANSSEIEFIEDGENPYVEIISYYQCKKRIDHNTNFEVKEEENRWNQYVFHLPQSIMQYSLD